MKMEQLEKGLFGFKKASVYRYVSEIEADFSAKLANNLAEYQKNEEQYRDHIVALEEELRQVKEQLEQKQSEQMNIAATLLEATRYAETLRQEAQVKAQKEREEWEKELSIKQNELEEYSKRILKLREMFGELLQQLDEETNALQKQAQEIKASSPTHNMILFERKIENKG